MHITIKGRDDFPSKTQVQEQRVTSPNFGRRLRRTKSDSRINYRNYQKISSLVNREVKSAFKGYSDLKIKIESNDELKELVKLVLSSDKPSMIRSIKRLDFRNICIDVDNIKLVNELFVKISENPVLCKNLKELLFGDVMAKLELNALSSLEKLRIKGLYATLKLVGLKELEYLSLHELRYCGNELYLHNLDKLSAVKVGTYYKSFSFSVDDSILVYYKHVKDF